MNWLVILSVIIVWSCVKTDKLINYQNIAIVQQIINNKYE